MRKTCSWCGKVKEIAGKIAISSDVESLQTIACLDCMKREEKNGKVVYPFNRRLI